MCNNLPQSKSTFHIRRNFIMSRDTTVAIISIALVSVSNLSCASEQVQNSGFIPGSRWCTYDGVNDVQSIHNASVKRINDVSTSAACQGLATQAKVLTYTWHDSTNGDYAYACILRVSCALGKMRLAMPLCGKNGTACCLLYRCLMKTEK